MQIDELFGSLRDRVLDPALDSLKDYFGGVQGSVTWESGSAPRVDVSFGERRLLSLWALGAVLLVGLGLGYALWKRG